MERTLDGFILSTGKFIKSYDGEFSLSLGCLQDVMESVGVDYDFTPEERAEVAAYFVNLWLEWAL